MKKALSIILLFSLLLCACTKNPIQESTDLPEQEIPNASTDAAESITPVYTQQPLLAVSVPAVTEFTTDENNSILFYHSYQTMHLVVQDPEVADKIIVDFLNRIDLTHSQAKLISQQALEDAPLDAPYCLQVLYSPTRIDRDVLSLFGTTISFSGGIHPDRVGSAANYNMVTGDVLTLGSILANINALEPLYQLLIAELAQNEDNYQLFSGYEEVIRQWLFESESYNEDWYFSDNGLCFFFQPYDIAPYASGMITVEIPYAKLTGIIGDAFFPLEKDSAAGTVKAVRGVEADLAGFTQIAEVSIDPDGEMVFLYTDETVYNVQLEVGSWDETGTVFTPMYTALRAASLTPGDAIMVENYFPDVLSNLRLTYNSDEQFIVVFVEQSGKDGSIYLVSE